MTLMVIPLAAYDFSTEGGLLCLDFANTVDVYVDGQPVDHETHALTSYEPLLAFAETFQLVNAGQAARLREKAAQNPKEAAAVLERALALRLAIFQTVVARVEDSEPQQADLETLNAEYIDALRHRRLTWDGESMRVEWAGLGEELASILWPIADSAVELLVGGDINLVRHCAGTECDWLFMDHTRNHSRRWCSMAGCGNRAKARRHYQKQKQR